jgi:multicomponent Na+:H+ antiporter subunit A
MLVAHALFKAPLFLVVGAIDKQTHCRDIRLLDGLARRMPATFAVALAAGLSMAGVVPLFGFAAKEAAFEALLHHDPWLLALVAASSALTVAYTTRALWGAFGRKPVSAQADLVGEGVHRAPMLLLLPAALPAALGLVLGLFPRMVAPLVDAAAGMAGAGALKLWPGLKPALAVSAVTLLIGLALFARREAVEHLQRTGHDRLLKGRIPSGDGAYRRVLAGLNRAADRITAVVQSGSLPVYLGIIFLTVLLLPGTALVLGTSLSGVKFGGHWMQFVAGGVMAGAAVAILRSRHRMGAVVLLGAVGYGMAGLFIVYGAPDLALTQLLIETLGIVFFALVLYRLPKYFHEARWRLGHGLRLAVSLAVGLFVTGAALVAGSASSPPPVSSYFNEAAYSEGGGRNVVNVILTDFRALDTLGEITVIATAAIGIAGLVAGLAHSRRGREGQ